MPTRIIRNAAGLQETARGFERLSSVPLIGGALGSVVGGVTGSADKAQAEAQAVKDRIEQIGLVVGLIIALGPVLIALAIYLPLRLPWRRDVRESGASPATPPIPCCNGTSPNAPSKGSPTTACAS